MATVTKIGGVTKVMSNPDSKHNYFAWPTVAKLQNGKIAAVASGFRLSHVCPFGKTVISYSENEGASWTNPAPIFDTVLDDRDGGILAFGENGVIVTSFNNTREFQRKRHALRTAAREENTKMTADDNYRLSYLETVSDAEETNALGNLFRFSFDCGVTFGPIFKSPVTSPHGPCVLNDGGLLWVGTDQKIWEIQAHRIFTDGRTEFVGKVEKIEGVTSSEPHAIQLKNGKLICHIRAQAEDLFTIYQTESSDLGKTWTTPHRILDEKGGAPSHLFLHSSGALIATFSYRLPPYGIRGIVSYDDGNTWSESFWIYDDKGISIRDLGYPSTIELKDGSFGTVFYAHQKEATPAVILMQKWRIDR